MTHTPTPIILNLPDVYLWADAADLFRVGTVAASELCNVALERLGHPPVIEDVRALLLYRAETFGGYLMTLGALMRAHKTSEALDVLTAALARVKESDPVLWSHKIPSREEFYTAARAAGLGDVRRCRHLAEEYGASADGMRQVLALRRRGVKVFEGD
ncbi:MAG: hypothetical protein CTY28_09615 [Hyphomicrobium sp.]|nr:MAG: hypothetical protein CTY28_09615 [Hyphomicrobium sp.]